MLLTFALKEEHGNLFNNYNYIVTGMGKVNATYSLTKEIYKNRPKLVVNLGSCGSAKYQSKTILNPTTFVDNDFSFQGLQKINGLEIQEIKHVVCFSSDYFVNCTCESCVDMEAFALASVCEHENIPFACIKYVTDAGDFNQWKQQLPNVAKELKSALEKSIANNDLG